MGEWGTVGTRKMLEQRKERWGGGRGSKGKE